MFIFYRFANSLETDVSMVKRGNTACTTGPSKWKESALRQYTQLSLTFIMHSSIGT